MKKYWFYTLFLLAYGGTNRLFFYIVPFFFIQCCIPAGIPLGNGTFLWFFLYIFQRRKAWFFLRLSSLFLLQSCTPVHCSQKTGLIRRTFFESDVQKTQEKRAASGFFAALLNSLPGFSPLLFIETNSHPQGEALLVSQNLWRKVSPKIQRLGSTWWGTLSWRTYPVRGPERQHRSAP